MYMNSSEIFEKLRDNFVVDFESFTYDTTINFDLEYTVGDAYCFIEYLVDEFQVDFSNYDSSKFFLSDSTLPVFLEKMFNKRRDSKELIPVTIRHIVKVIELGKWFDPPPSSFKSSEGDLKV